MRRLILVAFVAVAAVPARAALYAPDDPMAVPVRPDGTAEPFPFDEFRRRFAYLSNLADPRPGPDGQPNPDRAKVLARVKARPPAKTADEHAAACADLLRLGNSDGGFFVNDALNRIVPVTSGRSATYFALSTRAMLHAAQGDWRQAQESQFTARDYPLPPLVKGWTDDQRKWQFGFDDAYLLHYFHLRQLDAEAKPRPAPEAEEPTPLFPLAAKGGPGAVRFVTDGGGFEPGRLAAAEKAKLPPDAVAVTQQLLLQFPGDTRLYWLLAELYAADGKLDESLKLFDECAWSRQYGNRRALMDHRAAVAAAVAARDAESDRLEAEKYPISLRTVFIYFGVVVLVGVLALVRAMWKRGRSRAAGA